MNIRLKRVGGEIGNRSDEQLGYERIEFNTDDVIIGMRDFSVGGKSSQYMLMRVTANVVESSGITERVHLALYDVATDVSNGWLVEDK